MAEAINVWFAVRSAVRKWKRFVVGKRAARKLAADAAEQTARRQKRRETMQARLEELHIEQKR